MWKLKENDEWCTKFSLLFGERSGPQTLETWPQTQVHWSNLWTVVLWDANRNYAEQSYEKKENEKLHDEIDWGSFSQDFLETWTYYHLLPSYKGEAGCSIFPNQEATHAIL